LSLRSIIQILLDFSFDNFIVVEMPLLTTPAGRFCFFHTSGEKPVPPTIAYVSAGFSNIGSAAAQPFINFTNTGATSYSWSLYESETDTGSPTEIATGSGGVPTNPTNITYTGATIVNYWYYFTVTVTNDIGSANISNTIIQNYIAAPTITSTTFSFSGAIPSTQAQPYITFGSTDATSYTWLLFEKVLYEDDPTQIASGSGYIPTNPQTITYFGATVVDSYYFFYITVTNNAGSANYATGFFQNYLEPA
jgi:hypothetical protein